jgi:hypothetical protein
MSFHKTIIFLFTWQPKDEIFFNKKSGLPPTLCQGIAKHPNTHRQTTHPYMGGAICARVLQNLAILTEKALFVKLSQ